MQTFDDHGNARLASVPGLEYLAIESGFCGPLTAKAVGKNVSICRFLCRQDCLLDDASLDALLENRNLLSLDIGGQLSEKSIEKLAEAPKLKQLSLRATDFNEKIATRLKNTFSHLQSFQFGPQQLSFGTILKGDDGFERWVPEKNRLKFDELEGRSLSNFFSDQQHAGLLERLAGKATLVEFWGTWCVPCITYESELERLNAKYRDTGLQIVSVHSQQGHEQGYKYLKHHPKQWESVIDSTGELAESFLVPS